jgi:DNA modification methylase
MKVINKLLTEIAPYDNNPRDNTEAVEPVAASIREFGFKVPIVIDAAGIIVAGHTRYKAAQRLGLETVPCIVADDLTPEKIKAFRLADNRTGELAEWDIETLEQELADLTAFDFDMAQFGFDDDLFTDEKDDGKEWNSDMEQGVSLIERYVVPPFSVLDSRKGYWQKRKNEWKTIIDSGQGRKEELLGGFGDLAIKGGAKTITTGTSIFDPTLCEILYRWFCPAGGKAIDPFAGGSVRGLIASMLGIDYTGVDLRPEQIKANNANYEALQGMTDFTGSTLRRPEWIVGDSCHIDTLTEKSGFDFAITCPPYGDLEQYSDDPADLSNMGYEDFVTAYREIIRKTADKLKDNAFFAIVVGDIRDKKGYYRDFIGDTKQAAFDAGCKLLNDCVLIESGASAALRAYQFDKGRKVVKIHQNVLVFLKGDAKKTNIDPYKFALDTPEEI